MIIPKSIFKSYFFVTNFIIYHYNFIGHLNFDYDYFWKFYNALTPFHPSTKNHPV